MGDYFIVVAAILVVVIIVWYIGTSNGLKIARLKIKEADSGIDVALTKRYDVLTKLLAVVKEYKQYERETILETIKLRSGMSISEKNDAQMKMNEAYKEIKLTAENYPQLRSNTNFIRLQDAIVDTEEHLQAARRAYNANVRAYNAKVIAFPSSIVASMNGMTQEEFFVADDIKRNDVEMKF